MDQFFTKKYGGRWPATSHPLPVNLRGWVRNYLQCIFTIINNYSSRELPSASFSDKGVTLQKYISPESGFSIIGWHWAIVIYLNFDVSFSTNVQCHWCSCSLTSYWFKTKRNELKNSIYCPIKRKKPAYFKRSVKCLSFKPGNVQPVLIK